MAHMTSSLVDLSNSSDLKNLAQQPDIIMLVRKKTRENLDLVIGKSL
jgi:hypothetical protein